MMTMARRACFSVALGLIAATGITMLFAVGLHYVSPASNNFSADAYVKLEGKPDDLLPIVESGWIKVPFTITRTRECLAQSTVTLRRRHDYGQLLGEREDVVKLDIFNTNLTGLGTHPIMLWFRIPADLGPDSQYWDYEGKTQDDCGGFWDNAVHRPRTTIIKHLNIGNGRGPAPS